MRYVTPFDAWRAGLELARLGIEAQAVVWLRSLGATGAWNTPFDEGWRAFREKPDAFAEALAGAAEATLRGKGPVQVVTAATAPLHRRAQANRKRLEKRGQRRWPA